MRCELASNAGGLRGVSPLCAKHPARAGEAEILTSATYSEGRGYAVLFASAVNLVAALSKAALEGRLEEKLTHFSKPKLLIVDELGYLPFEKDAAHLFFQLVSRRYERGAMLVTTNRSIGEWGEIFGDTVIATAILDRLLHHSHVLTIRGESFRLREKRRSGLMKPALVES